MNKILVCQWGYSMTLYDFVEVLKETPKTLLVRVLQKTSSMADGFMQETVTPTMPLTPYVYFGKEEVIRLYKNGENWFSKKDGYYKGYKEWDGKPKVENHAD